MLLLCGVLDWAKNPIIGLLIVEPRFVLGRCGRVRVGKSVLYPFDCRVTLPLLGLATVILGALLRARRPRLWLGRLHLLRVRLIGGLRVAGGLLLLRGRVLRVPGLLRRHR